MRPCLLNRFSSLKCNRPKDRDPELFLWALPYFDKKVEQTSVPK